MLNKLKKYEKLFKHHMQGDNNKTRTITTTIQETQIEIDN